MALNEKLLEILACPQCHGKVKWEEKAAGLICDNCNLLYEVKNDIPIMLVEEAKKIIR
ncbi:MAG TPA: Trm112 family protein [Smithellaceae bacterium]|nr:Trm112 family protein [Smithellaceae bacterium]